MVATRAKETPVALSLLLRTEGEVMFMIRMVIRNPMFRMTQLGIVSYGTECGHPEYPGVYTRVTSLMWWITKHTEGAAWDSQCQEATFNEIGKSTGRVYSRTIPITIPLFRNYSHWWRQLWGAISRRPRLGGTDPRGRVHLRPPPAASWEAPAHTVGVNCMRRDLL